MSAHTPGPWRLQNDAGHPANVRIASTARPHVAKVYAESMDRDLVAEANARLIAAAPDMLQALKPFAFAAEGADDGESFKAYFSVKQVRAALDAITKAGGQP